MKRLLLCLALLVIPITAMASGAALEELLRQVKDGQQQSAKLNKEREAQFRNDAATAKKLLKEAKAELAEVKKRSVKFKKTFDQNHEDIQKLKKQLDERAGELKDLFAIVRQVAGDVRGLTADSMVAAQHPNRNQGLEKLMAAEEFPTIDELRGLWTSLQSEMTEGAQTVKFSADIIEPDGTTTTSAEVTRAGVFSLSSGDRFLRFDISAGPGQLQVLPRQPSVPVRKNAQAYNGGNDEQWRPVLIDPTRGALLSLLEESPTLRERVEQGGIVGKVILGLGAFGLLIALYRLLYLSFVGLRIRLQRRKLDNLKKGNPLGRILSVYQPGDEEDLESLELKLDDAILKELPRLERGAATIKLLAAVAPLLGLLGTVTGMIITFQTITLVGTGDPKAMAGGISQALVTTVLGLVVAIPLLFAHVAVVARSRSIIQVLQEQSAGLLASRLERKAAPLEFEQPSFEQAD